jgi:hypothetical protein
MAAAPLPRGLTAGALLLLGVLAGQPTAWAAETTSDSPPVTSLRQPEIGPALSGVEAAVPNVIRPAKTLRLDPLAASSADPLSNGVVLQPDGPGDVPLSSSLVTGALSQGGGLASLPLVGPLTGLVPG